MTHLATLVTTACYPTAAMLSTFTMYSPHSLPAGDDLDENFALSDEEDEGEDDSEDDGDLGSALDARRQAAAAGDHPLQKAFRQAAAKLAAKYGVEAAGAEEQEGESDEDDGKEGEEGSDEDGSEESDEGEAAAGTGSEGEADEGEEAAGTGSEGEADEGEEASDASEDAAAEQQGEDSSSSEEEQEAAAAAAPKQQQKQRQPEQLLDGPLDLSYTPPVPESYAEFAALVGGRPAQQLELAVQRIRVYNAAALATDSKRKLQVNWGLWVWGLMAWLLSL
jgi:nucleolar protein 14